MSEHVDANGERFVTRISGSLYRESFTAQVQPPLYFSHIIHASGGYGRIEGKGK